MKSISNGCLFCLRMDLVFVSTIARGVELSIFSSTLLHTLERCTFQSVRFPSLVLPKSGSETVCGQEEIRNCAQWFGTGPSLSSKRVPRHHTFFRVSSFVCPVTSRAGTQEICGPWNERLLSGRRTPMLVRNATFIAFDPVNFARYTVDSSLLPRFFFSLSLFFFILHPF